MSERVEGTITVYKVLYGGDVGRYSQYQSWDWTPYLPDGSVPGEWATNPSGLPPELCAHGLHGWLTEERAINEARGKADGVVYEMELEGDVVKDNEKATGRHARLIRLLHDKNGPVVFLSELVWQ